MAFTQLAAWSVILGLSLMSVGGFVLWAYGARPQRHVLVVEGVEAEATRNLHMNLVRWFFMYGAAVIAIGALLLLWAGAVFF